MMLSYTTSAQGIILWNNFVLFLAPQVGLEPTTIRLTAERSTTELLRNIDHNNSKLIQSQLLFWLIEISIFTLIFKINLVQ